MKIFSETVNYFFKDIRKMIFLSLFVYQQYILWLFPLESPMWLVKRLTCEIKIETLSVIRAYNHSNHMHYQQTIFEFHKNCKNLGLWLANNMSTKNLHTRTMLTSIPPLPKRELHVLYYVVVLNEDTIL